METHPFDGPDEKGGSVWRVRSKFTFFYMMSLGITWINFITVWIGSKNHKGIQIVRNEFQAALYIAIPLVVEFLIDSIVSKFFGEKFVQIRVVDHLVGRFFVVASLWYVAMVMFSGQQKTPDGLFAIVGSGIGICMTGILGTLQIGDSKSWGLMNTLVIISFFTLSQVSMSATYWGCVEDCASDCFNMRYLVGCIVCTVVVFIIMLLFSFRSLVTFYFGRVNVQQYSVCVLVSVVLMFLALRIVLVLYCIGTHSTKDLLPLNVYLLCGLVICASLLPARVVRRRLTALNNEMEYKKTFIRYITHEVRSPLSTTSLGLEYLIEQLGSKAISSGEAVDILKDAKSCCDVATNTLNDLLMLDKIETSMLEIFPEVVGAWDFMNSVLNPFRLQSTSRHLQLKIEMPDHARYSDLQLNVDKHKMEQVVRNFMSNAIKFTPAGGTITVTLTARVTKPVGSVSSTGRSFNSETAKQRQAMLCVDVKDTGPGISKADLPKLFGQYVQFNAAKLQGGKGSGLGLWLSKSIVELHQGTVSCYSEGEGKGCTFHFEVPAMLQRSPKEVPTIRNHLQASMDLCEMEAGGRSAAYRMLNADSLDLVEAFQKENEISYRRSVGDIGKQFKAATGNDLSALSPVLSPAQSPASAEGAVAKQFKTTDTVIDEAAETAENASVTMSRKFTGMRVMSTGTEKIATRVAASQSAAPGIRSSGSGEDIPSREEQKLSSNSDVKSSASVADAEGSKAAEAMAGRYKVLLADDDVVSRKMVERAIARVTKVCHQANNGQEAVARVLESLGARDPYDIVLIDYYMPVMNGADAIRAMRESGFQGTIIAVTGTVTKRDQDLLIANGANAVLSKPVRLNALISKIVDACATASK